MPLPVKLENIVDEMDAICDEYDTYLDRKTGELLTLPRGLLSAVEDGEEIDLLEWEEDLLPQARRVVDSKDFLRLPDQYEIHEYKIMERFCYSVEDKDMAVELLRAIEGSGAFRRFKDTLYRLGIQRDWYDYRAKAFEEIAIDWLETNEIPYRKDSPNRVDGSA